MPRVVWIVNLSKARQLGLFDRPPPMATPSHVVHVKPHTRMTSHGIEQVTAHDRTVASAQPAPPPSRLDRRALTVDTATEVSNTDDSGADTAPERSRDMFEIGKFEGDRESKTADVIVNGQRVGFIEVENAEKFVSASSRVRTAAFEQVRVVRFDGPEGDSEREYHVSEGFTRATGLKAAKAQLREWLKTPSPSRSR